MNTAELQTIRDTVKDRTRLPRIGEIHARARAEIREIMGPGFDVALLGAGDPALPIKWGDLTREEMAKVKFIMELEDSAVAAGEGYSDFPTDPASLASNNAIDAKFAADVRAVLGPKTDEFLVFNSRAAGTLQKRLARAGVELDEATYRRLYRELQELRVGLAANPSRHIYQGGLDEARLMESVLGVDAAITLASAKMSNFQVFDRWLVAREVEAKTRMEIYYLYMETTIRASSARSNPPADPAGVEKLIMVDGERLYRLLEAKLSPEDFTKFIGSGDGRMVDAWRKTGRMR